MPIETQKLEALVQVFEDFGYPPEYRRDRYPVWTGREVSTVALAGFGTSTGFDMTTSTMVGLIANGHASADGLDAARALAAPLALVARDDEIELWAVATAPENTARIATTAYHELPDFAGRYSVSLGRTTLWNAKQTGHQLALFPLDVRLLSHARGKTTEPPRESWRLLHARRSKQWPSRAGIPRS